jgi:YggT family protein
MIILDPLLRVLVIAIDLYIWAIIISAVLTWLVHFGVVNTRNQFVSMVGEFLWKLTEPAIRPIRRIVPNLGGIDISPVVLILLLIFLKMVIGNVHLSMLRANY